MSLREPPLTWTIDPPHGKGSRTFKFSASPGELASLAVYAGVDRVADFAAQAEVAALSKGRYSVTGLLHANFVQVSVVSLEEIAGTSREDFAVEYWPEDHIAAANLATDDNDVEPLNDGKIAFGALVSELFSVSIDPYPRLPGEEFDEITEGADIDEKPFAKLAKLTIPKSSKE